MVLFELMYCDPPWDEKTWSENGRQKSPDRHYPCMTLDQLKRLPVAHIMAKNSAIVMWVKDSHLDQAIELGQHWGFKYNAIMFTWAKRLMRPRLKPGQKPNKAFRIRLLEQRRKWFMGLGRYTRNNPEMALLFTRGKPVPTLSRKVRQFVESPRRDHSRKPDRCRSDLVELFGDIPRIELFARTSDPGWRVWGNETDKFKPA